jgi:predicted XRE-type DNA-binding protein
VWDAIEDTPEIRENLKVRSALMMALKEHLELNSLSQKQAAALFGVTHTGAPDRALRRAQRRLPARHGCRSRAV